VPVPRFAAIITVGTVDQSRRMHLAQAPASLERHLQSVCLPAKIALNSADARTVQLARLEGICALKALFRRWPKLALAVDESNQVARRPSVRAIEHLPVASPGPA
jgi:hypothetical protein